MKDITEVSVETWQHRLAKGGRDAAKALRQQSQSRHGLGVFVVFLVWVF